MNLQREREIIETFFDLVQDSPFCQLLVKFYRIHYAWIILTLEKRKFWKVIGRLIIQMDQSTVH